MGPFNASLGPIDLLQYKLLKSMFPGEPEVLTGAAFVGRSKLRMQLGDEIVDRLLACDTIIDFGCGTGSEVIELATLGCRHVIGLDIQERLLKGGREAAQVAGVADRCEFVTSTDIQADAVVSLDAFEHFDHPEQMLDLMHSRLKPGGFLATAFGPTWLHPLGGHLFSVFPWAHLLFTERALCRWRADFKDDGATRFAEAAGGLNQMTIRRFEQIIRRARLVVDRIDYVPIRKLRPIHNGMTREWTTALVRAVLHRPE
jgi:SAM-dependent methyltransferase